jgi:hypothetical protein
MSTHYVVWYIVLVLPMLAYLIEAAHKLMDAESELDR